MSALVKPTVVPPYLAYGRQTVDEADIDAVVEALRSPLLTCGPLVARFESALATAVGAAHVRVCSSGTAALHLAYAALGIGPGDEIITTPITFSATAAAAYYVGATVRIADVDPRTGNLSPVSVEALINHRTRAIVPVHLGGQPVEIAPLRSLARTYGLLYIEDACHALGATYRGTTIGSSHGDTDATIFSFHPVKHITTTGEGGAIAVRDAAVARRIEKLRQHGVEKDQTQLHSPAEGPWSYEVQELGWNYRLSDVAAAMGITQLAKLPSFLAARRARAADYRTAILDEFPDGGVLSPVEIDEQESAYHLFAVAIDFAAYGTTRDAVMRKLAAVGIGTQVHYIPLLQHPLHAQRCPAELSRSRPGADHYYARTLSLPLFPQMTQRDVDRVVGALSTALTGEAR